MKFSFLIPSKNRLELLRHTVDSVMRQEHDDFEIIICDNASEQDYQEYVRSLHDPRVIYHRQATPVSVTDNWRSSLKLATGDYILMLGDDDALAPCFASTINQLLAEGKCPDIFYLAVYHYCYPNVMHALPQGYLASVTNSCFLADVIEPFELPQERAREVARAAFDFQHLFSFNAQHFLFRAEFVKELEALGGVFQSPYPDTFAAVVSFTLANSIVVVPQPTAMVGISPKSFGYYYFNDLQTEGYEFLDNASVSDSVRQTLHDVFLPGDRNNTNWLIAFEEARRALASHGMPAVNIERYRYLQMVAFLRDLHQKKNRKLDEVDTFFKLLKPHEQQLFEFLNAAAAGVSAYEHRAATEKMFEGLDKYLHQYFPAVVRHFPVESHADIRDAFNWLQQQGEQVLINN